MKAIDASSSMRLISHLYFVTWFLVDFTYVLDVVLSCWNLRCQTSPLTQMSWESPTFWQGSLMPEKHIKYLRKRKHTNSSLLVISGPLSVNIEGIAWEACDGSINVRRLGIKATVGCLCFGSAQYAITSHAPLNMPSPASSSSSREWFFLERGVKNYNYIYI